MCLLPAKSRVKEKKRGAGTKMTPRPKTCTHSDDSL